MLCPSTRPRQHKAFQRAVYAALYSLSTASGKTDQHGEHTPSFAAFSLKGRSYAGREAGMDGGRYGIRRTLRLPPTDPRDEVTLVDRKRFDPRRCNEGEEPHRTVPREEEVPSKRHRDSQQTGYIVPHW